MIGTEWPCHFLGDPLHCPEKLVAFDTDDLIDQDEEACLTAESNISFLSEDSFTSSDGFSSSAQQKQSSCTKVAEVDRLLSEQEANNPCPCFYLGSVQASTGLTAVHRATVVDNMVAVAARLGLSNDSLFTAVACLDRYLAVEGTPLPLLQPTAIACLWLAAKYEQLVVPPVAQFALLVQSSDNTCGLAGHSGQLSKQLLLQLEAKILAVLDYRLASFATAKSFKASFMQRLHASAAAAAGLSRRQLDQVYCMTSYLCEVSLLEYRLLPCLPSQVAAAALVYAYMLLGLQPNKAAKVTGYSMVELASLLDMFAALHTTLSAALQLRRPYNVTVKYCSPAVRGVAHIPPELRLEQRTGGW